MSKRVADMTAEEIHRRRETDRLRRIKNRDEINERRRRRYRDNQEKEREYQRRRYRDNPQKAGEYQRRYCERHPEKARDRKRRYREENPEKVREYEREYKKEHLEEARESRRRREARGGRYGLTPEQAKTILTRSAGMCEICGSTKRLCWDHDHETGNVRGRLCHICNITLGGLGDGRPGTHERIAALVAYLEQSTMHNTHPLYYNGRLVETIRMEMERLRRDGDPEAAQEWMRAYRRDDPLADEIVRYIASQGAAAETEEFFGLAPQV